MADKRQIKRSIKQLQGIQTWKLVILLILMLFITATFLRINNTGMIARRQAIAAADKTGNIDDITGRVYALQRFSSAHMNASTGVFYLQEQYNRDAQQAIERAASASTENARINAEAEAICKPQFSGWSSAYMQCFLNELSKRPGSETLPEPELPNPALYRYSFVSPRWSPDFAGFSLLISAILTGVIIVRLLSLAILRMLLKHHYREL